MNTLTRSSLSPTMKSADLFADETLAPLEGADGFGCNGQWNNNGEYECSRYCRSIGYRAGYCTHLRFRCTCTK